MAQIIVEDIFGDKRAVRLVEKKISPQKIELQPNQRFVATASGGLAVFTEMSEPLESFANVTITPTYIFKSNATYIKKERSSAQRAAQSFLAHNNHNNELSHKAQKNIMRSLNWLYYCAKWKTVWSKRENKSFHFKVNFITLTIPSKLGSIVERKYIEEFIYTNGKKSVNPDFISYLDDAYSHVVDEKLFQECLHTWLTYARKYFYLGNYVWKIEAQKNGQLHIHISSDQFIRHDLLRNSWNRILQKKGLLDEFFKTNSHYNPNSTDVHSTKNMYNAVAYIGGYMKKDPNFCKQFNGRIWGCSKALAPARKVKIQFSKSDFQSFKNEIKHKKIQYTECVVKDKSGTPVAMVGHLFLLKKYDSKNFIHSKVKKAYRDHTKFVKSKTPKPPADYYAMDLWGEKTIVRYNSINSDVVATVEENIISYDVNQLKLYSK